MNIIFKNKSVSPIKTESLQAIQLDEKQLSDDSHLLLMLINADENEFLFI